MSNRFKAGDLLIYVSSTRTSNILYILLEDQKVYTDDLLSGSLSLILEGEGPADERPGQICRMRGLINYSYKYLG